MVEPRDGGQGGRRPSFEPLRPASSGWRAALLLAGPLLWLVSLIAVAYVVKYGRTVGIALGIVAISFLVSILVLARARARRVREEEAG
jgi:uncharacterized membrane protein YraQ (UPF0718 family)